MIEEQGSSSERAREEKEDMGDCRSGTVATREPSRVSPSRPSGRVSTIAWQSIETAPDDGTPFLALNHDGEVWVARNSDGRIVFRSHKLVETRRWFSKTDDDGKWLREDRDWEHRADEWRDDWTVWTRGYEFRPTMWLPLLRPPAQRLP